MSRSLEPPTPAAVPVKQPLGPSDRGVLPAAALSAVVYVVLGLVVPPDAPPVETATAAQIRAFLVEHHSALRLGALVGAVAIPTVLVLTTALARLVRSRLPDSMLPELITGGGILIATLHWLLAATASMTLVQVLDGTDLTAVDEVTLQGWYGLTNLTHFLFDLGMAAIALVMVTFSIAALRAGILPRWLCWLGLTLGVSGALGTAGLAVAWKPLALLWYGGLYGWVLWTLMLGAFLSLRWRQVNRNPAV